MNKEKYKNFDYLPKNMPFNKKVSYIIILVLFLNILLVSAAIEKVTLKPGESYNSKDKNITLIRSTENYAIFCVNQQFKILSRDQWFDNIYFDLISKNRESVTMKINVKCDKDCICTEKCDNSVCLEKNFIEENNQTSTNITIRNTTTKTNLANQELITPPTAVKKEVNTFTVLGGVTLVLILTLILLGIILLKTKKKQKSLNN